MNYKAFGFIGILIVVAAAALLIGGGFYFNQAREQKTITQVGLEAIKQAEELKNQIETADWQTYRNEKFEFEFQYPKNYFLKQVTYSFLLLREGDAEETDWLFEVSIDTEWPDEMTFEELATNRGLLRCAADGPDGSVYCNEIVRRETFMNDSGVMGYKLYLNEINERYTQSGTKVSERTRGPVFVLDISEQVPEKVAGIFFELTERGEASPRKNDLLVILDQMLSTFKFIN